MHSEQMEFRTTLQIASMVNNIQGGLESKGWSWLVKIHGEKYSILVVESVAYKLYH